MRGSPVRKTLLFSLPLGILVGAAGALAGISLLDEADEHVNKAAVALKKADDPNQFGEYGGHRKKALDLLEDVKREIKKAREAKEHHDHPRPPPPIPKPEPTSSGEPPKKPPGPPPPKKGDPPPPKKGDPPVTPPKK